MAIKYHIRIVCETETGDGKGWHYVRAEQMDAVDDGLKCTDHPEAVHRDFVVEKKEEVA